MKIAKNATTNVAAKPTTLAELMVNTRNVTRYYVYIGTERHETATEALKSTGMEKEKAQKMAGKVLATLKREKDFSREIDGQIWKAVPRV